MASVADIEMISKQTNIKDNILIEKTFFECNSDVYNTICKLLDVKEKEEKPRTVFDDLRMICDEKAVLFQNILKSSKN
jgi:hypothetical protein